MAMVTAVLRWFGLGVLVFFGAYVACGSGARAASAGDARDAMPQEHSIQVERDYVIPHLVSSGRQTAHSGSYGAAQGHQVEGMVGFGESVLEFQNRADGHVTIDVALESLSGLSSVSVSTQLDPLAADKVVLRDQVGVSYSDYAARVRSGDEVGIVARTKWDGGAAAAYEAPELSNRLLLPLFAVDVYSHTTILQLANTAADYGNNVVMELFDRNGRLVRTFNFGLEPGESGRVDPFYLIEFEGLPVVAGGGYVGSARFTSDLAVAIMAYGDEAEGRGTAALTVRPVSHASTVQHLPVIRANAGGDSLVALANPGDESVDVTIRYRGATTSASGAAETFSQSFTIRGRHHAIVDLDLERDRGNTEPPELPRGWADGKGFVGSATVSASAPILASVLEQEVLYNDNGLQDVRKSAAYNGFRPDDLARTHVVPRARVGLEGYTSEIVVMNPHDKVVEVVVDWVASGPHGAEREWSGPHDVEPGQVVTVIPTLQARGLPAQAIVKASEPVAVLVCETAPGADAVAYRAVVVPDSVTELPEPAPATATFTPSPTFTPSVTPTRRWPRWTPPPTWTPIFSPTPVRSATPYASPTEPPTYTPSPTRRHETPTATSTATSSPSVQVHMPVCYRP